MKLPILIGLISLFAMMQESENINTTSLEKPLSVCQVLQDLKKYQEKVIVVRGFWTGGTLQDNCNVSLQTENHKWPNALYLMPTIGRPNINPEWTIDPDEMNRATNELHRLQPGPVFATIIGRLNAKLNDKGELQVFPGFEGKPIPLGFGSQGMYPAQILMMSVKDIAGQTGEIK